MQREGINPENAELSDFLCDFCRTPWDGMRPMVEGHRGSLICGSCLTLAYDLLVNQHLGDTPPEGVACTMCLSRPDKALFFTSPAYDDARICRKCANQSAVILEKDKDWNWSRPPKPAAQT